jgi:hypothetical protein
LAIELHLIALIEAPFLCLILKFTIMKKIICTVLCSAVGLIAVSCEVDSFNENALKPERFTESIENASFASRDSIPSDNSTTIGEGEGPGDGVFPIKPPKKIN